MKRTIIFKSLPEFWIKEYEGVKCNTIREFDSPDEREKVLKAYMKGNYKPVIYIKIKNTKTGEMFKRVVTDVTLYRGFYIISWRPKQRGALE